MDSARPIELHTDQFTKIPPGVRYRVDEVVALLPKKGTAPTSYCLERQARLYDDCQRWLSAEPSLAELGLWMLDAMQVPELRVRGAVWLTLFPTAASMKALAEAALDPSAPPGVRDQAVWSLGCRQLREHDRALLISDEAAATADEALIALCDREGPAAGATLGKLMPALRHVDSPVLFARMAKAPVVWAQALECFGDEPLARAIFDQLGSFGAADRARVLRLAVATLGAEALPLLRPLIPSAPTDDKLQMLYYVLSYGGEAELPTFEETVAGMRAPDLLRQRARWHLANPGYEPIVRGQKTARVLARIPVQDRRPRAAQAAHDLHALTKFLRHSEFYLYELWGWMVRATSDRDLARELVTAHPESQRLVRDLHLGDLASRGRVRQLQAAAQTLEGADVGAFELAIHGRPLAALELAATARLHSPELVCARVLACYRAGRPDLADRILAEDMPPSEITKSDGLDPFPGEDENWLAEHAPDERPAVTMLVRGKQALLDAAQAAPADAEADHASLDPLVAVLRRLGRGLPGSTVYLAGEFKYMNKDAIAAAVVEAGARVVSGPFPGTDYYVHGDWCLVQTIAQLERQGTRRLRRGELEGI